MDFKKRLIEKLDLSTIAANTIYSVYIDVCEDVAKEYSAEQNKELIEENKDLKITIEGLQMEVVEDWDKIAELLKTNKK